MLLFSVLPLFWLLDPDAALLLRELPDPLRVLDAELLLELDLLALVEPVLLLPLLLFALVLLPELALVLFLLPEELLALLRLPELLLLRLPELTVVPEELLLFPLEAAELLLPVLEDLETVLFAVPWDCWRFAASARSTAEVPGAGLSGYLTE